MAKISDSKYPVATALDGTELVPIVQGGATKKCTPAMLQTIIPVTDLPAPGVGYRGRQLQLLGDTGVADSFYICIKNDSDAYEWKEFQFINL